MTVKAWCAEYGVTCGQYYRWQRKVYEAMQEPKFVDNYGAVIGDPVPSSKCEAEKPQRRGAQRL